MIKKIGRYVGAMHWIELQIDTNISGASFEFSGKLETVLITVGFLGCSTWEQCLTCLLHEIIEFEMVNMGTRFNPSPDFAKGSDGYLFSLNHCQYSQVIARAACFVSLCLPDLGKAFKKWKRSKKWKK